MNSVVSANRNLVTGYLTLEDGSCFQGISFGADHSVAGEVVFNTGMTGYPETLSDPSYKGQILILTYPLIGNYGVPVEETANHLFEKFESESLQISALLVSDYSSLYHHWNSGQSLGEWLKRSEIPALFGIDTRALTKKLRERGTMLGRIEIRDEKIGRK